MNTYILKSPKYFWTVERVGLYLKSFTDIFEGWALKTTLSMNLEEPEVSIKLPCDANMLLISLQTTDTPENEFELSRAFLPQPKNFNFRLWGDSWPPFHWKASFQSYAACYCVKFWNAACAKISQRWLARWGKNTVGRQPEQRLARKHVRGDFQSPHWRIVILITNNSTVSEENPLVAETVLFLKEKELKDCKEQISRNFPIIINSAMKK